MYRKNVTMPASMLESGFNLYQNTVVGNRIMPSLSSNKLNKEIESAIVDIQSSMIKEIEKSFTGPFWNAMSLESFFKEAKSLITLI